MYVFKYSGLLNIFRQLIWDTLCFIIENLHKSKKKIPKLLHLKRLNVWHSMIGFGRLSIFWFLVHMCFIYWHKLPGLRFLSTLGNWNRVDNFIYSSKYTFICSLFLKYGCFTLLISSIQQSESTIYIYTHVSSFLDFLPF